MTVSSEFEANIVRERMAEAAITVLIGPEGNPREPGAGTRDIYVEDADLERARAVLQAAGAVDQDELDRLSRQSGPPVSPGPPMPGGRLWKAILKRGRKAEGTGPVDLPDQGATRSNGQV